MAHLGEGDFGRAGRGDVSDLRADRIEVLTHAGFVAVKRYRFSLEEVRVAALISTRLAISHLPC